MYMNLHAPNNNLSTGINWDYFALKQNRSRRFYL